jgi:diguanylate cyclase (GGDEF)-like protein
MRIIGSSRITFVPIIGLMFRDPSSAEQRNEAIDALGLLERAGDPILTGLTRVASYVTGAQAAAVHILDDVFQRRIAATNVPLGTHPREDSMCRLVVDSDERIVCADASLDPRFGYSSFVRGPDPVRFYVSVPLRTSDGAVIGSLCAFDTIERELTDEQLSLFEDVADQIVHGIELTRVAAALSDVASHDPLTGAVNRLVLGDHLARAFHRQLRGEESTYVALIDIDRFKQINDVHGHAAGDEVLVAVARRLMAAVRTTDTVARVGGDEFVVLVEHAPEVGFEDVFAARLAQSLSEPVQFAGAPRPVSASVGCVPAQLGEDIRTLLARADAAMYASKAALAG